MLYETRDNHIETAAIVSGVIIASFLIIIVVIIIIMVVVLRILKQKQTKKTCDSFNHSDRYHDIAI